MAYVLAAERLDPAHTAMIGDQAQDIVAARHNRVMPYGVSWGYGSAAELTGAGAGTVFSSAAEMVECFHLPEDPDGCHSRIGSAR